MRTSFNVMSDLYKISGSTFNWADECYYVVPKHILLLHLCIINFA